MKYCVTILSLIIISNVNSICRNRHIKKTTTKALINQTCSVTLPCDVGLTCYSGICNCSKSHYYSSGQCYSLPSEWVWNSTINLYYAPVHAPLMNWTSSKSWCQSYGGDLFTVTTTDEYNFLGDMYKILLATFWVNGASRAGFNFQWLPNGTSIPYTYSTGFWCPTQPDNGYPIESCLEIGWCGSKLYNDRNCDYLSKFLCEKKSN